MNPIAPEPPNPVTSKQAPSAQQTQQQAHHPVIISPALSPPWAQQQQHTYNTRDLLQQEQQQQNSLAEQEQDNRDQELSEHEASLYTSSDEFLGEAEYADSDGESDQEREQPESPLHQIPLHLPPNPGTVLLNRHAELRQVTAAACCFSLQEGVQ